MNTLLDYEQYVDRLKTDIAELQEAYEGLKAKNECLLDKLEAVESEANAEYREKHSLYNSFCKELEENKQLRAEVHAVRKYFAHEQNLFLRKWEAERIEYNYKGK